MEFLTGHADDTSELIELFRTTFTASEGADEGALIGRLVADMFETTAPQDMLVISVREGGAIVGAVIFTRMDFPRDPRSVFILSPAAVAPDRQGRGIGQELMSRGLAQLRTAGVDMVLTYGDPHYYKRVGFAPITTEDAQPPLPLQYPDGWLGQSLDGGPFEPLAGPSRCVSALAKPEYW